MEQRKPRNKKGVKHQKPGTVQGVSGNSNVQETEDKHVKGIKKLTPDDYDYMKADKSQFAHLKRETEDLQNETSVNSAPRRQIVSNWHQYEEVPDIESVGKDFQSLLDAPISAGGHFVFKSEKNWAIEITKYSDLFSLNVKNLATAINSIPLLEYMDVEEKYFTKDQLTRIKNETDKSKAVYADLLNTLTSAVIKNKETAGDSKFDDQVEPSTGKLVETQEKLESFGAAEEDLDFLLSLTEPVKDDQSNIVSSIYTTSKEAKPTTQSTTAAVKSIDLEKWLDSVLDD